MTWLSVVELPGLLRVLTLMILLGGTMCVLLYRDRPASAGLIAATLGIWLALSAIASSVSRRGPARSRLRCG